MIVRLDESDNKKKGTNSNPSLLCSSLLMGLITFQTGKLLQVMYEVTIIQQNEILKVPEYYNRVIAEDCRKEIC